MPYKQDYNIVDGKKSFYFLRIALLLSVQVFVHIHMVIFPIVSCPRCTAPSTSNYSI